MGMFVLVCAATLIACLLGALWFVLRRGGATPTSAATPSAPTSALPSSVMSQTLTPDTTPMPVSQIPLSTTAPAGSAAPTCRLQDGLYASPGRLSIVTGGKTHWLSPEEAATSNVHTSPVTVQQSELDACPPTTCYLPTGFYVHGADIYGVSGAVSTHLSPAAYAAAGYPQPTPIPISAIQGCVG